MRSRRSLHARQLRSSARQPLELESASGGTRAPPENRLGPGASVLKLRINSISVGYPHGSGPHEFRAPITALQRKPEIFGRMNHQDKPRHSSESRDCPRTRLAEADIGCV